MKSFTHFLTTLLLLLVSFSAEAQSPARNILYADFIGPAYGLGINYERVLLYKNGAGLNARIGAPVFSSQVRNQFGNPVNPAVTAGVYGYLGKSVWKPELGANFCVIRSRRLFDRQFETYKAVNATVGIRRQAPWESFFFQFNAGAALQWQPYNFGPDLIPSATISLGKTFGPTDLREPEKQNEHAISVRKGDIHLGVFSEIGLTNYSERKSANYPVPGGENEYFVYNTTTYSLRAGVSGDVDLADRLGVRFNLAYQYEDGGFSIEETHPEVQFPDSVTRTTAYTQYYNNSLSLSPEIRYSVGNKTKWNFLAGFYGLINLSAKGKVFEQTGNGDVVEYTGDAAKPLVPQDTWGPTLGLSVTIPSGKVATEPFIRARFAAQDRTDVPALRDNTLAFGVTLWLK